MPSPPARSTGDPPRRARGAPDIRGRRAHDPARLARRSAGRAARRQRRARLSAGLGAPLLGPAGRGQGACRQPSRGVGSGADRRRDGCSRSGRSSRRYTGPDAEHLARAGLELLGEDDDLFRALALQAVGMAQWSRRRTGGAVETWRPTLDAATRTRQPMAVFPAVTALANGLNQTGRRDEAEALCRRILEDVRRLRAAGRARSRGGCGCRSACSATRRTTSIEARRELERGFAAASTFGGGLLVAWAVGYLALVRQATGSPEAALEVVRAVSRATRTAGLALPAQTSEIEARILLMQGDVAAAARWADQATPDAPAESPLLESPAPVAGRDDRPRPSRPGQAGGGAGPARPGEVRGRGRRRPGGPDLDRRPGGCRRRGDRPAGGSAAGAGGGDPARGARVGTFGGSSTTGARIAHLLPFVRKIAPAFVDEVIAAFAGSPSGRRHAPHPRTVALAGRRG